MDMNKSMNNKQYNNLLVMIVLSFMSMFVFMYAMVNTFLNVFININQFYMAGLMTMPMILIELFVMRAMYDNKKLNTLIISGSAILLVIFFIGIRQQTLVSDKQFLKSMIPHHASAILMCEKAALQDLEIKELCKNIIINQQLEIDQMKLKLNELP